MGVNSNVITITSDSDGQKTNTTISYTFVVDDGVDDFQPSLSITDGVTGETPDSMTMNFKGASDPASHSFTFGSNQTLDQLLTRILLEGNNFIEGITFYDGNAFPTTTLVGDITAGVEQPFIEVASTAGFTETGTVTLAGGDTFTYTSLTIGSDLFGSCSVGTHTDRTSCETEGVFTPHIRLNGTNTTFTNGDSSGATVTSNARRHPGVDLTNNRRIAWEYDDVRSNGEIVNLVVTGTATDGDVTLTIDGTAVTAGVLASNTLLENVSAIRSAINTALVTANSDVTTVVGDVSNTIRLIGNVAAGDYTVSITDMSGLSITNPTFQAFENPTVSTDMFETGGSAGGNFDVINSSFSTENEGLDEVIIGELTTADITINGVTYTITYQGREGTVINEGVFTPFEPAVSDATGSEIATQLADFLNRQP